MNTLLSDLSVMVGNPLFSDVEIVAKDNEMFFAHSFMLSARCEALSDVSSNLRLLCIQMPAQTQRS